VNQRPNWQPFLVYGLLFYLCTSGVLIVMFFSDLCFCDFICLVLLVNALPSLLFKNILIQGFSSHFGVKPLSDHIKL
jgi:hypothetical protein